MKNFIRIFAVVVLIIATCLLLKFLSTVFDDTWNHSWFQPTLITLLFAFYGFLYKNKDKKIYYTDDEVEVICPCCGKVCDNHTSLLFADYEDSRHDGISMCKKCIEHPENIDENKVYENLRKSNWRDYDIAQIKDAIHRLQKGDESLVLQF